MQRPRSPHPAACGAVHVSVFSVPEKTYHVRVHVRVDAGSSARNGSHIRLRAVSVAENEGRSLARVIMDGIVATAGRGELFVILFHPPPPELEQMQWLMYHAGITTTARTMLDAIIKISTEGPTACSLHGVITGSHIELPPPSPLLPGVGLDRDEDLARFNQSQRNAILSSRFPLSLIWGPPGRVAYYLLWG